MINRTSGVPLYLQLADKIRDEIKSGKIIPGEKLMSENEMANYYRIGRLTIREALSVLVNEGLLAKQHGKGTFCIAVPSAQKRLKFDIILDMTDVYFIPYYLQSICSVFEDKQCEIVINDTKNDIKTINSLLEDIAAKGSDGVILQPCPTLCGNSDETAHAFDTLIRSDIPYIMLDGVYENVVPSYVILDEREVGRLAAQYFLSCGHKNLCVIHNNKYRDSKKRTDGFAEKLNAPPLLIDCCDDLKTRLPGMIALHPEITGIFCYNDLVAKECMEILADNNISVPDEISVISVDDTVIASTVTPPLTSIVHPKEKLGEAAAAALYEICTSGAEWPYKKIFTPELAVRRSVKKL